MRTLIRFLLTFKTLFLFLFLQAVSLFLIIQYNDFQQNRFLNSSNIVIGQIYQISNAVAEYFKLKTINDNLAAENTELRNKLTVHEKELDLTVKELDFTINELNAVKQDSNYQIRKSRAPEKEYTFITAKVINASYNKKKNYLTLDKGVNDKIRIKMGVINESGVVGIVSSVSDHFAVVLPILNTSSKISAKIKNQEKIGSLVWDGEDARFALLEDVPQHVTLQRGDTVVTSGYSSIFPEGIGIGTVRDFKKENNKFRFIQVKLFTNFNQLSYVDVIDYRYAEEQEELEKKEGIND